MSAEETIYHEALAAIERGERVRARDLLTRLLKVNQNNAQYWLWMSAVVESTKERIYCLKEVLRRDPENETARRGLIFSGALTPPADLPPAPMPRRTWQVQDSTAAPRSRQYLLLGGAVAVLALLVYLGLIGSRWLRQERAAAPKLPTLAATLAETPAPTGSATSSLPTPTPGVTPLWMLLESTYTPTPLYVNTPHPRTEAYRSGLRAYERQAWPEMLNYFQQVATAEPDQVDILYHIGEAYRLAGKFDFAIRSYNDAIALAPNFAPPRLGMARALLASQPAAARQIEDNLREALRNDPNLHEAYLELANFHIQRGLPAAALADLQPAEPILQHSPLFYYYRAQAEQLQGQTGAALTDARRANELDVTFLPAYRLIGRLLQEDGKISEAVKALETYTRYQTDDVQALVWLGQAYQAQKDEARALAVFERVLQVKKDTPEVYLARGQIHLERREAESALDDFDNVLRLKPDSWDAALGKGQALMLLGYNGDAYIHFNRSEGLAESTTQKAALYYWRAQSLEALRDAASNIAALRDWDLLLALPAGSYPAEWAKLAQEHRIKLFTATPSPQPTSTQTPTRTPLPSASPTPTPTRTPSPSASPTATSSITPTTTSTRTSLPVTPTP